MLERVGSLSLSEKYHRLNSATMTRLIKESDVLRVENGATVFYRYFPGETKIILDTGWKEELRGRCYTRMSRELKFNRNITEEERQEWMKWFRENDKMAKVHGYCKSGGQTFASPYFSMIYEIDSTD